MKFAKQQMRIKVEESLREAMASSSVGGPPIINRDGKFAYLNSLIHNLYRACLWL